MSALRDIVDSSSRIVFFGGAGVSTESGIPDFRSAGGLYNSASGGSYAPEEMLSRSFFNTHTEEFFDYYRTSLIHPNAKPNQAHLGLASLERKGKLSSVITQNIDGLHSMAGSKRVLELHGSIYRNNCMDCGAPYGLEKVLDSTGVPLCDSCGGVIKPDVVLYKEALDSGVMDQAIEELSQADTLIVGGTSLAVYPAAGLIRVFQGDDLVLINRDSTPYDAMATLVIHNPIGETLAEFIDD
ncbi:NAD-dependent protein deacylase [Actinomycetaceae bacterium MB13-C1-2]|nr:NAD-dependent protein deacylase [Actinomycetaceae bacterium MB13-C1-2]